MKRVLLILLVLLTALLAILLSRGHHCSLLKIRVAGHEETELLFLLNLSGCGCASDYENIFQWKRLHKALQGRQGVGFQAYALQNQDKALESVYGFPFVFSEEGCRFKARSMTLVRQAGKVIFRKEGGLSVEDYLLIRKVAGLD